MKVILYSYDDYANLMFGHCQALKSVGVDAACYKLVKHPFGYAQEATIVSRPLLDNLLQSANIIIGYHSFNFNLATYPKAKKIIVHTGTGYRQNVQSCNDLFNPIVDMTLTDQCEFMNLGAKNIHYVACAIDTDKIKPIEKEVSKPYLIGHYPSNQWVKGTAKIVSMMEKLKKEFPDDFIFDCDLNTIPHEENLKRIAKCDVYIELFAPMQGDKEYGCFGVTAFETAALAVVCITQNPYEKVYQDVYRGAPFLIANSEILFKNLLETIFILSVHHYLQDCSKARTRIVQNHSYQATGNYLKKLLEIEQAI